MPKKTINIQQNLTNNTVRILEDGELDLTALGQVLSRRRVGLINPSEEDPSKLEVTVIKPDGEKKKLAARYTLKKEAVAAEVEEAKKMYLQGGDGKKPQGGQEGVRPCTGPVDATRCPWCRGQMYPSIIVVPKEGGGKKSKAVYLCTPLCPLSSSES